MTEPTAPAALCGGTLDALIKRFDLDETENLELVSVMGPDPVGVLRTFTGADVHKAVYISLVVEAIGLDSHMLFAFAAPDSAVPHFTLDSVHAQGNFALHLDLIPRVELATNLAYMDEVYAPLTPVAEATRAIEGMSPAVLTMRQYAVMSPWMLVQRATPEAFAQVGTAVDAYLDRFAALAVDGVQSPVSLDADDLAARDRRHREVLFSADVDPVWVNVGRLLGPELTERLRLELAEQ